MGFEPTIFCSPLSNRRFSGIAASAALSKLSYGPKIVINACVTLLKVCTLRIGMAWPFGNKKSKQLTIVDNAIAYVEAGDFDKAYDELNDTKEASVFLFQRGLEDYKRQFMSVKAVLGEKKVDREATLALLAKLRRSAEALIASFDELK